jgi:hypothetical protein
MSPPGKLLSKTTQARRRPNVHGAIGGVRCPERLEWKIDTFSLASFSAVVYLCLVGTVMSVQPCTRLEQPLQIRHIFDGTPASSWYHEAASESIRLVPVYEQAMPPLGHRRAAVDTVFVRLYKVASTSMCLER